MEFDLLNLHHAYLIVGEPSAAEAAFYEFFKERGVKLAGSPDFFLSKLPVFGVDEARALNASAVRKAFTDRKIFLILPEKLTGEAQNALLKTFEDPYPATHFFLIMREEELILPTLRSRMQLVRINSLPSESFEAAKFISLPPTERIAFARKFAERERNLSAFLDELMLHFRREGASPAGLKNVYEMRRYSDDRGAASRLILEHLALVL